MIVVRRCNMGNLQLPLVHKNRKLWPQVVKTTFLLSVALIFAYIWLEDYVDERYQKLPYLVLIILIIGTSILIKIPLRKHKEIGHIIFSENSITTVIFNKPTEVLLDQLDKLEIKIVGHHGQEYFWIGDILPLEDGTGNFITSYKNGNSKKTEFYLATKEQLNSLRSLITDYHQLTKVELVDLHK